MIRMCRAGRNTGPYKESATIHTERGKPMKGVALGIVLTIAGLALWLTTEEVENAVISLHKAGLILAIVGAAEALFALLGLAKKTKK